MGTSTDQAAEAPTRSMGTSQKMTSIQQRAALQRQIWAIANDVRGSVDGWDFKQYVLGTLFYQFISEKFVEYITGGDDSVDYGAMDDNDSLFADLKTAAAKIDQLRSDIDAIVLEIEAN